jgi:hypothetical protein
LVGDHFVARVLDWDEGRPVRALLLRVVPLPFTAGSVPDDPVWALSPATLERDGLRWDEPDDLVAAAAWNAY